MLKDKAPPAARRENHSSSRKYGWVHPLIHFTGATDGVHSGLWSPFLVYLGQSAYIEYMMPDINVFLPESGVHTYLFSLHAISEGL